jgi:hypothetical protein
MTASRIAISLSTLVTFAAGSLAACSRQAISPNADVLTQQGELIVLADGERWVELLRQPYPDCCTLDNRLGLVEKGERGHWYLVAVNHAGDPMILATIKEAASGTRMTGWLDCRDISIENTLAGRRLTSLEAKCSTMKFDLQED